MNKLLTLLIILLLSLPTKAQLNTLFINIVDISVDSNIVYNVCIWKQMPDSTYKMCTKSFYKQTMISLDPGKYTIEVILDYNSMFRDKLEFIHESCVVYNLYSKPLELGKVDFKSIIYASPGMIDLMSKRMSYMEF